MSGSCHKLELSSYVASEAGSANVVMVCIAVVTSHSLPGQLGLRGRKRNLSNAKSGSISSTRLDSTNQRRPLLTFDSARNHISARSYSEMSQWQERWMKLDKTSPTSTPMSKARKQASLVGGSECSPHVDTVCTYYGTVDPANTFSFLLYVLSPRILGLSAHPPHPSETPTTRVLLRATIHR